MEELDTSGIRYGGGAIAERDMYGTIKEEDGYELLAKEIIRVAVSEYKKLKWHECCYKRILEELKKTPEYKNYLKIKEKYTKAAAELVEIDTKARSIIEQAEADGGKFKLFYPFAPVYGISADEYGDQFDITYVEMRNERKKANQLWDAELNQCRTDYKRKLARIETLDNMVRNDELSGVAYEISTVNREISKISGSITAKHRFFKSREFGIYCMTEIDGDHVIAVLDRQCAKENEVRMLERAKNGKHPFDIRLDRKDDGADENGIDLDDGQEVE